MVEKFYIWILCGHLHGYKTSAMATNAIPTNRNDLMEKLLSNDWSLLFFFFHPNWSEHSLTYGLTSRLKFCTPNSKKKKTNWIWERAETRILIGVFVPFQNQSTKEKLKLILTISFVFYFVLCSKQIVKNEQFLHINKSFFSPLIELSDNTKFVFVGGYTKRNKSYLKTVFIIMVNDKWTSVANFQVCVDRKSLESMNCHVSSKMSRTLNSNIFIKYNIHIHSQSHPMQWWTATQKPFEIFNFFLLVWFNSRFKLLPGYRWAMFDKLEIQKTGKKFERKKRCNRKQFRRFIEIELLDIQFQLFQNDSQYVRTHLWSSLNQNRINGSREIVIFHFGITHVFRSTAAIWKYENMCN